MIWNMNIVPDCEYLEPGKKTNAEMPVEAFGKQLWINWMKESGDATLERTIT